MTHVGRARLSAAGGQNGCQHYEGVCPGGLELLTAQVRPSGEAPPPAAQLAAQPATQTSFSSHHPTSYCFASRDQPELLPGAARRVLPMSPRLRPCGTRATRPGLGGASSTGLVRLRLSTGLDKLLCTLGGREWKEDGGAGGASCAGGSSGV